MKKLHLLYQILCVSAALGMTSYCTIRYLRNDSVVAVNYKEFHATPKDVYPSFTICFVNREFGPFVDSHGIEKSEVSEIMRGRRQFNTSLLKTFHYGSA